LGNAFRADGDCGGVVSDFGPFSNVLSRAMTAPPLGASIK
jgi:hypothetical protein